MEENMKLILNELKGLNNKVDTFESNLSKKIDAVEDNLNKRIDTVEANLNKRIDTVEANLNNKIDAVEANLNKKIDELDNKIDTVEANLTKKIDSQGDLLHQLIKIVGAPNPYVEKLSEEVATLNEKQNESTRLLERLSLRSIAHEVILDDLRRAR